MTHDEINRKVAALRGVQWPDDQCPICGWHFSNTWENGCTPDNCSTRPAPLMRAIDRAIPDYCTDPAAWGALLVALAGEESYPSLRVSTDEASPFYAIVLSRTSAYIGHGATPGEALALAYIASQEAK